MNHPEPAAEYDIALFQKFLTYSVKNLRSLCFYLNLRLGRPYEFHTLGGANVIQQSMELISIATDNHELGEFVFQVAYYWIHNANFRSQVLIDEGISNQLLIYCRELKNKESQNQADVERLEKVRNLLTVILGKDFTDCEGTLPNKYFEHGYAMLIGVGDYFDPAIPALPATVRDVLALGDVLRDKNRCGYREERVNLATGPGANRKSILDGLDWLAQKTSHDPKATAIFYFSGHGWRNTSAEPQQYYLIPHDFDWEDPDKSGVNNDLFMQKLAAIRAKKLVIILDACFAGGMSKDVEVSRRGFAAVAPPTLELAKSLEQLRAGSGRVIISSSRESEQSYTLKDQLRSVFTECLIQALSGEVSSADPETIGITDVFGYLDRHVPILAVKECGTRAQQHPVMDVVQANNFPIALRPAKSKRMQGK